MLKQIHLVLLCLCIGITNGVLFASSSAIIFSCLPVQSAGLSTSNITETTAVIHYLQPIEESQNQFRIREVDTDSWQVSSISTLDYRLIEDLIPGTMYEFQSSHICSDGTWTAFSDSAFFTTTGNISTSGEAENNNEEDGEPESNEGEQGDKESEEEQSNEEEQNEVTEGDEENEEEQSNEEGDNEETEDATPSFSCETIDGTGLTTSSVTETTGYIHNSHHDQSLRNQFRYRVKGDTVWTYTDISTVYYRFLTDLLPGTIYEFQANQECSDSTFSDFSITYSFTTFGPPNEAQMDNIDEEVAPIIISEECQPVGVEGLYVTTIKQFYAYIYTPQPYGAINNQFRYRPVGSPFWLYTSISATYYRWLRNLKDGTDYEYQVSHECSEGIWSPFSESFIFTTLPSIN